MQLTREPVPPGPVQLQEPAPAASTQASPVPMSVPADGVLYRGHGGAAHGHDVLMPRPGDRPGGAADPALAGTGCGTRPGAHPARSNAWARTLSRGGGDASQPSIAAVAAGRPHRSEAHTGPNGVRHQVAASAQVRTSTPCRAGRESRTQSSRGLNTYRDMPVQALVVRGGQLGDVGHLRRGSRELVLFARSLHASVQVIVRNGKFVQTKK